MSYHSMRVRLFSFVRPPLSSVRCLTIDPENPMNLVARLALVISLLGAFATWLFLGPLASFGLQIWASFIMWGAFYHCGGGVSGFKAALAGGVWGAVRAAGGLYLFRT